MDSRERWSLRKRSDKRRHQRGKHDRRRRSPSSDYSKDSRSRSKSYSHKRRVGFRNSSSSNLRSDSFSSHRNRRRYSGYHSKNGRKRRFRHSSSRSSDSSRSRSRDYSKKRKHRNHSSHRKNKKERGKDKAKKHKRSTSSSSPKKAKHSSSGEKDRSQDAGHFKYKLKEVIKNGYQIIQHLSDGTFGRVFDVLNLEENKHYAMKIIRAVPRYVDSAKIEADILKNIRSKDKENRFHFVELREAFNLDENYCMVFERLGLSLYDFMKKNQYRGYPIKLIQSFFKQTLESIGFMHAIGLTHTDLKPENILLCTSEYKSVEIPESANGVKYGDESDERSSTMSRSKEKSYLIPASDKIKIIDFGGATYDHEHHSSIINTRQYRAPEVILGCCNWSTISDLWSIGCIIAELYTGDLFFETHESYEHLAMIEKSSGPIPLWMANRCEKKLAENFDTSEEGFRKRNSFFDWPHKASGTDSIKRVNEMRNLDEIIRPEHKELKDLLKRLLTIDPNERINCREALKHEFFTKEYENEF